MPPSPSLRCSPGREHRMENTHKRGHSFESGLTLRAKDDDLTLFNDMQNRERESFLLHTADDFDDSLSKLRYLSDFKLGITIPARGKSSDLLNVDGEKNDYDWLLTPPDTPLFPSLDDEEPHPQNVPPRGRPRSQPINISRSSSVNEKTRMSSRSSASPRRLSPSPRSSNNFGQLISRPSSAPRSSPPPLARPATPSRRPSTPPNKPSTPTSRSSTPTLRRMSTGSSGQASSSGRRGTSPMRACRGNSASPKLRGWQSNLPGFSSDAPPNLRTSLSDRPLPHVRGLSPTPSRSGRGGQSMSPTASRSASSSHSNDRDLFSAYSKGSVVSSGDDDMDSLHSLAISSSPPARRNGMLVNSRPVVFSKKPSRTSPSNYLPKRSFESVLRQMDNRKTPQNMFRPLLSSVPSTTFYVGKSNSTHRPMFSRNSSLTTSTSSDQGASVAPDMEGSEHEQNDLTEGWERKQEHDAQDEVFIFDKADDIIEDSGQELDAENPLSGTGTSDAVMSNKVSALDSEDSMANFGAAACAAAAAEFAHATGDLSVVDGCEITAICSKCGKRFHFLGADGKTDLCQECEEIDGLFAAGELLLPPTITQTPTMKSEVTSGMDSSVDEVSLNIGVPDLHERSSGEIILRQHENNIEEGLNSLDNSCPVQLVMDQSESQLPDQQLDSQKDASSIQCDRENKFVQTEPTAHPSLRIDNHEGTGISVLLVQQSSSSKWPVVQSRAFSATNILCAEPSYVRDNNSAMRRSIGRDSASASSSMDMGSSRQINARVQRQISNRKVDMDSVRSDTDAKSQCSGSYSDLTINAYELFPPKNDTEVSFNSSTEGVVNEVLQESVLVTRELDCSLGRTDMNSPNFSTCKEDFVDNDVHINDDCFIAKNTSNSQLLSYSERHHYETSAADNLKDEDHISCMNANEDPWRESEKSSLDIEVPNRASDSSFIAEQRGLNDPSCQSDISDVATNSSAVILESQNDHDSSHLQTECGPVEIRSNEEAIHKHSVSITPEQDMLVSNLEAELDDHAHGIREESTAIVEGPRGHTSRSLTLAEATDTILFCSSIIHDIAYKAATIGMEKELVLPPEATRPTVTIPCKSVDNHNDSRKVANKHTPKSHKFKRKLEAQTKSPLTESGNNVIVQGSTHPASMENIPKKAPDSTKPLKLESKCNCTVM